MSYRSRGVRRNHSCSGLPTCVRHPGKFCLLLEIRLALTEFLRLETKQNQKMWVDNIVCQRP